ncbi:MAG: VOC family protein [Bryobacteraceae bacterium]|nr:VOC family protein [Bryobacteraceae bacterium]
MSEKPRPGTIGWVDLTVPDAVGLRDFYGAVVGWSNKPVDIQGYQDFCMIPPGAAAPAAGICHARGLNADLPPVWLIYITVENLDASLEQCKARGGEVISPVRSMGASRYAMIKDPAGAVCALFQP